MEMTPKIKSVTTTREQSIEEYNEGLSRYAAAINVHAKLFPLGPVLRSDTEPLMAIDFPGPFGGLEPKLIEELWAGAVAKL
jgi:hypothetical protein